MAETYTYTARNAEYPDKVITFTLYNGHMRVNLTGVLEDLGEITAAEDKQAEARRRLKTQAQPTTLKVIENITGPLHVTDAKASLSDDEHLRVTAWKRMAGLRFAPIMINAGRIDNPEAAEAFVEELDRRSETTEPVNRFVGPLDYWLGWIGVLFGVFLLLRWPKRE